MRNMEVLAPAGNLEIFKTVIDAGADAVYFGGKLFSARAYANNFDFNESKEALNYAHLHGKKAYLTLNTLVKNIEFNKDLFDYLNFYYENGLDGIIVQDIGVIKYIRDNFPDMCVHGSTQMAVCNSYGAKLCKELGLTRIVPARELSLSEIKIINENVDIELEVFVHGALCYCYSGDCLMSSLIGGRSGNRGRCAQPCRLEYDVYNDNNRINTNGGYVLSLKDLCGINDLDKLYRSGVSSLKIEGRMKKKQYASNVVNVYRRYVDRLMENVSSGKEKYFVDKNDEKLLFDLGNRCGFTNSYYYAKKDNMVTFKSPSHENREVSYEYKEEKLSAYCYFKAKINEPIEITIIYNDITVNLKGTNCEKASNKPVVLEDIIKRLNKTGNTSFIFEDIKCDIDDNIFVPLGEINRLRKNAIEELQDRILLPYKRNRVDKVTSVSKNNKNSYKKDISELLISVQNNNQLETVISKIKDFDLIIPSDSSLIFDVDNIRERSICNKIFLELPIVIRDKSYELLEKNLEIIRKYDGYIVSGYDGIEFIKDNGLNGTIISGSYIYTFNNNSIEAVEELGIDYNIAPYELNSKELLHRNNTSSILTVYGRYPMMITNNCINKNCLSCDKVQKDLTLKDKKGYSFLVRNLCKVCYNVIYNENPTYLLDEGEIIRDLGFKNYIINFVNEDTTRIIDIINQYNDCFMNNKTRNIDFKYTKGHFKRGVE